MNLTSSRIAIVLFGGTGSRFSLETPKQFANLNGKPLCYYAVNACERSVNVSGIIIVANKDYVDETKAVLAPFHFKRIIAFVPCGDSRQDSVLAALNYLDARGLAKEGDYVLIQDGDRPAINEELIYENFVIAKEKGGAVTAFPSTDSVFLSENKSDVSSYMDRSTVFRAETPQTFPFKEILNASRKAKEEGKTFTDDASCHLFYGGKVGIVLSNGHNQKITRKEDIYLFQGEKI